MAATRSKRSRETIAAATAAATATATASRTTTSTNNQSNIRRLQPVAEERGKAEPIPKHSQSNMSRKRIKLLHLHEKQRIRRAAAAMEEQLASFEQQNTTHAQQHLYHISSSSFRPDDSASSSFFFEVESTREQGDDDLNSKTPNCNDATFSSVSVSDEEALVSLSRSLRLEESPPSSGRKLLQQGHRRRGGISVVMTPRR